MGINGTSITMFKIFEGKKNKRNITRNAGVVVIAGIV